MDYHAFAVETTGHIAQVTLNRPDALNTMNADFWRELPTLIRDINAQGTARVIVLSSTGKHFCAGMDLAVFTTGGNIPTKGDPARLGENLRRLVLQLQDCFNVLEEARMPVISAIQGGCIGGALDMICATDMRYCTEDAYFTIKETHLGMTADLGTLQRLPTLIPQGIARELAYTGRRFTAQEAKQHGLVNDVYPTHEAMMDAVMGVAHQIAEQSPMAVAGCKEMLNYSRDHSVADSLKYMATWQSGMFRPEDMMKSFAAKAQKTTADFDPLFPITLPFQK